MKKTDIALENFKKFVAWLDIKYPPKSIFEKVHVSPADEGTINVYYCFQYGQLKKNTPICTIPAYPVFDPEFNPNTFYQ